MLVTLYDFAKERNSTALPGSATPRREFECIIKDPFTLTNPTIIFKLDAIPREMYCYIPDFGRYYFIDSWTFSANRWFAVTSVDVLASRKTDILATTQYVLRSASQFDRNIADSYYPAKSEYKFTRKDAPADFWVASPADVTFVLDISGKGNATYLYAFSYAQFLSFSEYLLGNTEWLDLSAIADEISEQLSKMLFNPLDYIASCRIYPIKYSSFISAAGGTAVTSIPFGWWSIQASARRINKSQFVKTLQIVFSDHPQAAERGNWLNLAPYTRITAYFPPFGTFEIPPEDLVFGTVDDLVGRYIKATTTIDLQSGNAVLRFTNIVGNIILEISSKVGVDMPLFAQSFDRNTDPKMSAILSGANALVSMEDTGKEVPLLGDGIQNVLNTVNSTFGTDFQAPTIHMPDIQGAVKNFVSGFLTASTRIQSIGSAGSMAAYSLDPSFMIVHTLLVDDDNSKNGRPLAKSIVLNTLVGYTTCQNPHLALAGYTPAENDAVNAYLSAGFYIE